MELVKEALKEEMKLVDKEIRVRASVDFSFKIFFRFWHYHDSDEEPRTLFGESDPLL